MTDRLEEIRILLQKRIARSRGPTSSNVFNDSIDEISHDLANFSDQWTNRLVPLTDTIPNGSDDASVDAFLNGLDGRTLYVHHEATASASASYYNTTQGRPRTIYEQFRDVYQNVELLQENLEGRIDDLITSASIVAILDNNSLYDSINVEDALAEVMSKVNLLAIEGLDLSTVGQNYIPAVDKTYSIGTSTKRIGNIYTGARIYLNSKTSDFGNPPEKEFFWEINTTTGKLELYDGTTVVAQYSSTGAEFPQNNDGAGGTTGSVQFKDASGNFDGGTSLFWDISNERLGIGTDVPDAPLHIYSATNKVASINSGTSGAYIYFKDSLSGANTKIGFLVDTFNVTAGSKTLTFNSSGKLGVNRIPTYALDVKTDASDTVTETPARFYADSDYCFIALYDWSTDFNYVRIGALVNDLLLYAGNAQRIVIKDTGKIGIGTNNPSSKLEVSDDNLTNAIFMRSASSSATVRPIFAGIRSRGSITVPTAVQNGDDITGILASAYNSSDTEKAAASIEFIVDGAPGTEVPAKICFCTATSDTSRAERVRIDSTGNLIVVKSGGMLQFEGSTSSYPAIKRDSTTIALRLADDSDYADLKCASVIFSGNVDLDSNDLIIDADGDSYIHDGGSDDKIQFVTNSTWRGQFTDTEFCLNAVYLSWNSASRVYGNVDGYLTLTNSAGDDFDGIQFGGTTNSYPMLQRYGATNDLQIVDATAAAYQDLYLGNLRPVATGAIAWSGRTQMYSSADGYLKLVNNAGSDFTGIQLGGTDNSYPMLKRSGDAIHARLADDSNYCSFYAAQLNASDKVVCGSNYSFQIGSKSQILSAADGSIKLADAANTDFDLLQFGGTTAAYPAWKRDGTTLKARLADDSENCDVTCSGLTTAGPVGIGTDSVDDDVALEIDSSLGALLMPRMTTAVRDTLSAVDGMVVYNTTVSGFQGRANGSWVDLH